MWRTVAALLLIGAVSLQAERKFDPSQYTEEGRSVLNLPRAASEHLAVLNEMYTDSGFNQYSVWTINQRNLAFDNGNLVYCFRRYGDGSLGSGALGLVWSTDGGATWTVDWPVGDGLPNDSTPGSHLSRYPNAVVDPISPGCSWAELLVSPSVRFGQSGMGLEIDYNTPGFYGTFTAENGAHKTNMWVDPQGINWFGVAFTVSDTVIMYTFDPATGAISNEVPSAALSGVLPGDGYAIGPNGEFGVFGYMTNPADTTQTGFGYSWYDPNTGDFVAPVFAFQDTFANGWFWDDGAFGTTTDEFFFVTDVMSDTGLDLPDAVYFIHYNAGNVSVTRLDDPAVPKRVHYPQIAVSPDRQTLVVLWAQADPATGDTAIGSPSDGVKGYMWDIYAVGSTDGGQTWGNPVNLTNTPNLSEWMPHLAKNLDVVNGKFYFVYATDLSGNNIDGYVNVLAPNGALVSPMYHVTSEDIVTSVSEGRVPVRTGTAVVFEHNRLNGSLGVRFSARTAGQVRVDLINVLGQTVRSWTRTAQVGENAFTLGLNGVAKGTYVVRLVTPEGSVHTGKFAVLR